MSLPSPVVFCQCPPAKNPYSWSRGYGRTVLSSFQLLHSAFPSQHYQSYISHNSTWSYLTKTSNSSVYDAPNSHLLGNLRLLHSELYVHNRPGTLTAPPVTSAPRYSGLSSTSDVLPRLVLAQISFELPLSQSHQDRENPTEQSEPTPPPSYESALQLPLDSISFTLACVQSIDWLLILLIRLCYLWLFFNCSFVLCFFVSWLVSLELVLSHFLSLGFRLTVHALYSILRSDIVPMVPIITFCLHLIINYTLIWNLCLHIPPPGTTLLLVWLNTSLSLLFLVSIGLLKWTKSSNICPCVKLLAKFFLLLFFQDSDDQAQNMASVKSSSTTTGTTVMPKYSCLFPVPFDGTIFLETSSFYLVPFLLLIGKTTQQVICVLNFSPPQWQRLEFLSLPDSKPAA